MSASFVSRTQLMSALMLANGRPRVTSGMNELEAEAMLDTLPLFDKADEFDFIEYLNICMQDYT